MAAGLGFKTFTTGEVLSASDVNGYLMQGVLVFASTAARDAAITSPQEGQFAFTKDTDQLWYRSASAWVASGATGDIEGVTAGVGISGGGTSGTVTITNDMATTITASGDIVVGTGSGTYDNLPIGTTGQVLTADTTVSPYKVKWATAGATGKSYTLLNSGGTSLSGSTTTISGISAKDSIYVMIQGASTNTADDSLYLQFNGDTASNYQWYGLIYRSQSPYDLSNANTTGNSGNDKFFVCQNSSNAASTWSGGFNINGAASTNPKMIDTKIGTNYVASAVGGYHQWQQGVYNGTSAISSITFGSRYGSFDAGTVFVYASA
jgi:hypothetical protein